ncbi:hypothetical protein [Deinococcus ruber]|uniref:Uncharacterized protein n=1 Tax=Deinococcus ruber TaxID=1848197 RepID=A0A918CC96_9DEIO|nr:hypothetical protein [Deinococcus ruber]GGR16941.1 hypothetical protein GCM10008957_31980 [Deinococcus ruber]
MTTTNRALQAGEVGRQLTYLDVQEDLTGAVIELVVEGPGGLRTLLMAAQGAQASRVTLASDFPEAGAYSLQLRATWPDRKYLSAVHRLSVQPNL